MNSIKAIANITLLNSKSLLLIFVFSANILGAQNDTLEMDSVDYSFNKTIPEDIKKVALLALSHYPELHDAKIEFIYSKRKRTAFMQAQPRPLSLLGRRDERVYKIIMAPNLILDDKVIPISELPEMVLLGWLGHELGHILDYHNRKWYNIAIFGVAYVIFEDFKIAAERTADLYSIERGLGEAIVSTKNFILEESSFPEYYKNKIRNIYMSPEEVLKLAQIDPDDLEELDEEIEDREDDMKK